MDEKCLGALNLRSVAMQQLWRRMVLFPTPEACNWDSRVIKVFFCDEAMASVTVRYGHTCPGFHDPQFFSKKAELAEVWPEYRRMGISMP